MSYTPTTWKNNDVITAERLNKMEQGIQNEQVGPQGPKGDTGEQGPQGPAGKDATLTAATTSAIGAVKMAAAVADAAGDNATKAEFNALLTSLRNAVILSTT